MQGDVPRPLLVIAFAASVVFVAFTACDPDPARTGVITCERVYRVCPGVVPANHTEAAQCADIFQGRCGAEMRQHVQCATGRCDDAGGHDRVAVERACVATIEAYRACTEGDGGGGGVDEGQLPPFDAARSD